ncbi:MAG: hypothetical protein CM1200mP22_13050 [Dehalococcoidia bacterium]|nr:MAG: hypothetical protein CM1200mP22_13050 [Dehalococcoidia bacterium]
MRGLNPALRVAFSSGSVMGITVGGIGLLGVTVLYVISRTLRLSQALVSELAPLPCLQELAVESSPRLPTLAVIWSERLKPVSRKMTPEILALLPTTLVISWDVAGMGADLFESYCSSIIAAMALAFAGAGAGLAWDADKAVLPLMLAGLEFLPPYSAHLWFKAKRSQL